MNFNDIDKETLKELRGKLFEKKKAQERVLRDLGRIKADEEYRLLLNKQKKDKKPKEMGKSCK